ncbi:hypothetical protein [Chlorobaculum sp. 24CR]|uniref:hypothetical protein n=1 Tax=Chlorobaculum sp. 24CR TaxID=2508878 RepID=UPI00100AC281|nr:hypothetical protein [Chlorobaculum sp. 24CR]
MCRWVVINQPSVRLYRIFCRHCEEHSDVAIHLTGFTHGLLLPKSRDRNDEESEFIPENNPGLKSGAIEESNSVVHRAQELQEKEVGLKLSSRFRS